MISVYQKFRVTATPMSHISRASMDFLKQACGLSSGTHVDKVAYSKVVLIRHGQCEWTAKNLFCGWYDSGLSERGKQEVVHAGVLLRSSGFTFDMAFTSVLLRAQYSLELILQQLELTDIEVEKTWRLNERHYGALTGMNKIEMVGKYGEQQVAIWRRSYDVPPPPMEPDHPYFDTIVNDGRYENVLTPDDIPRSESLKLTCDRVIPFWNKSIHPQVKAGKNILIVTHGSSLRGIIKHLDNLNAEEISSVHLPNGIPFVYSFDSNGARVGDNTGGLSMQYLGDPEMVHKGIEEVSNQMKLPK